MERFEYNSLQEPVFVGRERELDWLDMHTHRYWNKPIFVTGPAGVGKTALLKKFLSTQLDFDSRVIKSEKSFLRRFPGFCTPIWIDLLSATEPMKLIDEFVEQLKSDNEKRYREHKEIFIVIDGAEALAENQIEKTSRQILNWKVIRSLVYLTQRKPERANDETLVLGELPAIDAAQLLKVGSSIDLPPELLDQAMLSARGNPSAISLLAKILKNNGTDQLSDIIAGRYYDFSKTIAVPSKTIIASIKPQIVTANEALVAELKKQPQAIYDLHPRKFEEIVAELLSDMGYEVHLTQQTRDGGKDILAYLKTDLGKMLCLVEAKRHRRDRKVGIGLVRTLYGTLCDYQASSAMLVTTSSFSSDARLFQKKHEFQMALKEYGDVVQWIQRYKKA